MGKIQTFLGDLLERPVKWVMPLGKYYTKKAAGGSIRKAYMDGRVNDLIIFGIIVLGELGFRNAHVITNGGVEELHPWLNYGSYTLPAMCTLEIITRFIREKQFVKELNLGTLVQSYELNDAWFEVENSKIASSHGLDKKLTRAVGYWLHDNCRIKRAAYFNGDGGEEIPGFYRMPSCYAKFLAELRKTENAKKALQEIKNGKENELSDKIEELSGGTDAKRRMIEMGMQAVQYSD